MLLAHDSLGDDLNPVEGCEQGLQRDLLLQSTPKVASLNLTVYIWDERSVFRIFYFLKRRSVMISSRAKSILGFMLSTLVASSTIFCMENTISCMEQYMGPPLLYFACAASRDVTAALAVGGMKFAEPEADFLGKDILNVLPEDQKGKVRQAFDDAVQKKKPAYVGYELENEEYAAAIIPFFGDHYICFTTMVRKGKSNGNALWENNQLSFTLDADRNITAFLDEGIKYVLNIPEADWLGKHISEVLGNEEIEQICRDACAAKELKLITYRLEKTNFLVQVIPLFDLDRCGSFFVQVWGV